MPKLSPRVLAALLASGALCTVAAAAMTPGDTIFARQANFKQLGRGFKAIADELRKPAPSVDVVRATVPTIGVAAGKVANYFPRGTGAEAGTKTAALPAIWERNPEFQAADLRLLTAVRNLQTSAASGDLDRIKAATGALGGACKGCHDTFRARE